MALPFFFKSTDACNESWQNGLLDKLRVPLHIKTNKAGLGT